MVIRYKWKTGNGLRSLYLRSDVVTPVTDRLASEPPLSFVVVHDKFDIRQ
jgi:hypothetical protein